MLHWPFVHAIADIQAHNSGETPEELLEEVVEAATALGKKPEDMAYADSEFTYDEGKLEEFEDFVHSLPQGKKANFPNIPGLVKVSSFNGQQVLVINDHGMTKLWM